jgi:hypothetical protein
MMLSELPTADLAFWRDFEGAVAVVKTAHKKDYRKDSEEATVRIFPEGG